MPQDFKSMFGHLSTLYMKEVSKISFFLGIIENITELRPEVCVIAGQQGLLTWLLKRIKVRIEMILTIKGLKRSCVQMF